MRFLYKMSFLCVLVFSVQCLAAPMIALGGGGWTSIPSAQDSSTAGLTANAQMLFLLQKNFAVGITSGMMQSESGTNRLFYALPTLRFSRKLHRHWSFDIVSAGGVGSLSNKFTAVFTLLAGTRFFISPRWQIGLCAGWMTSPTKSSLWKNNATISASVEYRFGFHDIDGDWIPDEIDRCQKTPRGARVNSDGRGIDSDGDGVFDGLDKCDGTPLAALVDSLGCPTDSDNDGVFDGVDRCPDTPQGIPIDTAGCPRDSDHDGVADYADSCAGTPLNAIVDHNGCPIDSDEDGVPDGIDQCSGTPTGFEVNLFGCPKVPSADGEIIYNLFDDALQLTASALNQLSRVAKRIRAYPDKTVVINVHTDGEGSRTYNRNRAASVGKKIVDFLTKKGISEDILKINPVGEQQLIAKGLTSQAKRKNRRAVFEIEE